MDGWEDVVKWAWQVCSLFKLVKPKCIFKEGACGNIDLPEDVCKPLRVIQFNGP